LSPYQTLGDHQGNCLHMMRFLRLRRTMASSGLLWLLALIAVGGCGKHSPYACVPVSGKVTFSDGSLIPADEIHIVFVSQTPPSDPKISPKNGIAEAAGTTGAFDFATTYGNKDGIIVGTHKVVLHCLRKGKQMQKLIAPEYSDPS